MLDDEQQSNGYSALCPNHSHQSGKNMSYRTFTESSVIIPHKKELQKLLCYYCSSNEEGKMIVC